MKTKTETILKYLPLDPSTIMLDGFYLAAEDHIYSYFESRYDGDDSDELPETLEERYQRALDAGDAEKLAEIFQNKYDCNISEDFQWDTIVEDFYDFYDE